MRKFGTPVVSRLGFLEKRLGFRKWRGRKRIC
jgi:hypothetical protein